MSSRSEQSTGAVLQKTVVEDDNAAIKNGGVAARRRVDRAEVTNDNGVAAKRSVDRAEVTNDNGVAARRSMDHGEVTDDAGVAANKRDGSFFPRREDGKGSQQIDLEVLPAKLGRYLLLARIGAGSVGVVYEGLDCNTDKPVAVKVMQDKSVQFSDEDNADWVLQRRRFFDEARACGRMRHRNILQVMDMGIEQGLCFIVTELVPGAATLGDFLAVKKQLSSRQAATVLHHCAGVLDHTHRRKVLHRDIKPENILLPEDHSLANLKLADFGIAHMEHNTGGKSAEILGSPRYMSPEQIQGMQLSPASDFFSLGVVAYELLAGQHPFRAADMQMLCRKIISSEPVPLEDINPDIPPNLLAVIKGCLIKDPRKRIASGRLIVDKLATEFPGLGKYDSGETMGISMVNAMRKLDFFNEFNVHELQQTADICLADECLPGGCIIEEGMVNDSFFVIVTGDVLVQKGEIELGRLNAGDCFGEMGYLTSIQRTATVLAIRKTTVIKFNVDMVSQLPAEIQLKFSRSFIRLLVNRLAATTSKLTAS